MTDPRTRSALRADQIDALLPQTQCGQCGYRGCAPYAEAIAAGAADINRCPPGGAAAIHALAALTGKPVVPLDPSCGTTQPWVVARIEEAQCIGCTLCIQACPVDAIIGAARHMHTVAAGLCTGCRLCVPPCPVDCIVLEPAPFVWDRAHADLARQRYQRREARRAPRVAGAPIDPALAKRRALIAQAVASARARLKALQ